MRSTELEGEYDAQRSHFSGSRPKLPPPPIPFSREP
jgi:hypothetical protein